MWLIDRYYVFQFIKSVRKSNWECVKTFFASFCLKYLVPTISVISVKDLWSVIRIYKKRVSKHCCNLSTRARQDNCYTVQWLDSAENSSTIPQNLDFEEKLPLFNVISESYRTRLIHTIFDIFWQWCKNIVDPKYISFKTAPGITIWQSHGEIQVWSVISVTFPSMSYVIYMGKNIFDNQRAKHIYPF